MQSKTDTNKKMKRGGFIMKLKKLLSLVMVTVMTGTMMVGCGKGEKDDTSNSNETSTPAVTEGASETEAPVVDKSPITLTYYSGSTTEDPWTDPVAKAITEATGVTLEVEGTVTNDDQRISLMIAEQDYTDLIFTQGKATDLVAAGALIDMTDLIEQYGPNIKKLYGDEIGKLKFSKDDPGIYMLSAYGVNSTSYKSDGSVQIQYDVMKENNYAVPKSLQEYETMIKNYMAAHPTTEDGLKTIGLSLSTADWRWYITLSNPSNFIGVGDVDNGNWHYDKDYNAEYRFRKADVKEYYRWLNRMYNEGVLDPDFATQTHEDYIAKIASGRVLSLMDAIWDYGEGEKVLKADGKYGKTYVGLPITKDESVKCPMLAYAGLIVGQGVGISSTCKDPVRAIQFLDYYCSDEGQVLRNWGIKDVNYFVDENGKRYRTEEEINRRNTDPDYGKTTGVGFRVHPFPAYGDGVVDPTGNTYTTVSKEAVIAEYDEEQKAACQAWGVELLIDIFPQTSEFEVPKISPLWAYTKPTEFNDINTRLDEIAWTGLIKAVINKEADFDKNYDAMVKDLEDAGMSEAESLLTDIIKEKLALTEQ